MGVLTLPSPNRTQASGSRSCRTGPQTYLSLGFSTMPRQTCRLAEGLLRVCRGCFVPAAKLEAGLLDVMSHVHPSHGTSFHSPLVHIPQPSELMVADGRAVDYSVWGNGMLAMLHREHVMACSVVVQAHHFWTQKPRQAGNLM